LLKRNNRLPSEVFRAEKTFSSSDFVLKISKNQISESRFGFVVSKKIDKRATARNRIKRTFRACIEEALENIKPGLDFLFIVKKAPDRQTCLRINKLFTDKKFLK
jgi:ribonuclease P protein component